MKKNKQTGYIYAKFPRCFIERYSEIPSTLLRGRVNYSKSSSKKFRLQNHWGEDYLFFSSCAIIFPRYSKTVMSYCPLNSTYHAYVYRKYISNNKFYKLYFSYQNVNMCLYLEKRSPKSPKFNISSSFSRLKNTFYHLKCHTIIHGHLSILKYYCNYIQEIALMCIYLIALRSYEY